MRISLYTDYTLLQFIMYMPQPRDECKVKYSAIR